MGMMLKQFGFGLEIEKKVGEKLERIFYRSKYIERRKRRPAKEVNWLWGRYENVVGLCLCVINPFVLEATVEWH